MVETLRASELKDWKTYKYVRFSDDEVRFYSDSTDIAEIKASFDQRPVSYSAFVLWPDIFVVISTSTSFPDPRPGNSVTGERTHPFNRVSVGYSNDDLPILERLLKRGGNLNPRPGYPFL